MRAEKEMGGDADADGDGDGRKGRGLIGREVTRVPPLPSSLPSFFIYISCVVKRNRDKLPKDGGSPGVGSLDGPFSFRSGSIQLAISFIALYYYTTSYVFLHHRSLCRQQPCPLRPGLPIHDPSFYHSLAAWQPKSRTTRSNPMMARTKRAY